MTKDIQTVTPVKPDDVIDPNQVDIRDEEKHLLFKFNALTDVVEIKARGKLYRINVGELRFVLKRNVISDAPVTVFDLQPETPQEEPGQAETPEPTPTTTPAQETPLDVIGTWPTLDNEPVVV